MEGLVYLKAGDLKLVRHKDGRTFMQPGVIESIEDSLSLNTKSLPNGNSTYDFELVTGSDGQVVVNLSSFQPHIYAALIGAEYKGGESLGLQRIVKATVPSVAPYEVDLTEEGTISADFAPIVHDATDSPFVKSETTPSVAGEFGVSGSIFTFSSADAGESVKINFEVTTTVDQMTMADEANFPVFEMTAAGEAAMIDDQSVVKRDATIFDAVKATGNIAKPKRSKDPGGWSFTMKFCKPRPGNKAVDYRVES